MLRFFAVLRTRHHSLHKLVLIISLASHSAFSPAESLNNSQVYTNAFPELLVKALNNPPELLKNTDPPKLLQIYKHRNYELAWSRIDGVSIHADHLLAVLRRADEEGLNPDDYHIQSIEQLDPYETDERVLLDLLLTDAFIKYITHISVGRFNPELVDPEWHIKSEQFDPVSILQSIAFPEEAISTIYNLSPKNAGYTRLKESLRWYRQLARQGGWPVIPAGPSLKPGDANERILLLRLRLLVTGEVDYQPAVDEYRFDDDLQYAVRKFQEAHGLKEDGIVGPNTIAALNIPVEKRIEQIKLNMERWRWLPNHLGDRYLIVNMAGYRLQAIENEHVVLNMRAIVGKPYRATPAFNDKISYLEYNPVWNIPPQIALEDLIPIQRRDPDYFKRKGIRVFTDWSDKAKELDPATINWNKIRKYLPYKLQQDPGPRNSLGRIKFMFPNKFNVYLHDTPYKYLFNHNVRTLSSGCIRVEQPILLAGYVQGDTSTAMLENIQTLIEENVTLRAELSQPIPIYLVYWTAWTEPNGTTHFRNDIYGRDQVMTMDNLGFYNRQ